MVNPLADPVRGWWHGGMDTNAEDRPAQERDGYVPTTTHAEWGAGNPHLRFTGGSRHPDVPLDTPSVTIGSGADVDVRLEGAASLHAEIVHDDRDEFVLVLHAPSETSGFPSEQESVDEHGHVLRTGASFTAGPWTLVFLREEFADHGRPYGGRQGGEGAVQPEQPPRPDYAAEADAEGAPHSDETREEGWVPEKP